MQQFLKQYGKWVTLLCSNLSIWPRFPPLAYIKQAEIDCWRALMNCGVNRIGRWSQWSAHIKFWDAPSGNTWLYVPSIQNEIHSSKTLMLVPSVACQPLINKGGRVSKGHWRSMFFLGSPLLVWMRDQQGMRYMKRHELSFFGWRQDSTGHLSFSFENVLVMHDCDVFCKRLFLWTWFSFWEVAHQFWWISWRQLCLVQPLTSIFYCILCYWRFRCDIGYAENRMRLASLLYPY